MAFYRGRYKYTPYIKKIISPLPKLSYPPSPSLSWISVKGYGSSVAVLQMPAVGVGPPREYI